MTDLSLRLPNSRLRAVLNLGARRASSVPLPVAFAEPELFADWDEDERMTSLFVGFETGQLHVEATESDVAHHFHGPHGEDSENSPWSKDDTATLVAWAALLAADFHAVAGELLDDISEAAAWHDEGFDLYVCEVEVPTQLDLIEIEVEGELMTLPWLGAGSVAHEHIDGEDHPIALMWSPHETTEPDLPIAQAWTDPRTEAPRSKALPGVKWDEVGLPADEVLSWLEGIYFNHHVKPDAEGTLLAAVLERMGGLSVA